MADSTTTIAINLRSTADTSGVKQARSEFDALFADLKAGVADALSAGGASPAFVDKAVEEFDRLHEEIKGTELSAEQFGQKVGALEQKLLVAARAEKLLVDEAREFDAVMKQGAWNPAEDNARWQAKTANMARGTTGMKGYKGSVGDAALAMAYFADDAQYGIRAIMNNIPQMALMFGLGGGVAGAIGLATVALGFLWEKFGGAKEAKEETDKLKQGMEEVTTAINDAAEASREAFSASMDRYLEQLREATQLWGQQKQNIQDAKQYTDELAKAELESGKAKLEIARQNELAAAKTEEQRAGINSRYDQASGMMDREGREAAMQRAMEAKQLEIASQKSRTQNAEGAKASGQQSIANIDAANQEILGGIGQQSDQAKRRSASQLAQAGIDYLDGLDRDLTEAENTRRNKFIATREQNDVTKLADEAALKTGKGVTFEAAKKQATEAGDAAGLAKYTAAEEALKSNTEARSKIAAEIEKADAEILKLKLEAGDLERSMILLKKQQEAARLQVIAADAKTSGAGLVNPLGLSQPLPLPGASGGMLAPPPVPFGGAALGAEGQLAASPLAGLPGAAKEAATSNASANASVVEHAKETNAELLRLRKDNEEMKRQMKLLSEQIKSGRS